MAEIYDIAIIGGGPAGLTAALYARRANKTAVVLEKGTFGGQITYSPKVENIPGFLSVTGNEFAEKLVEQVMEQGADVECCEVLSVRDGEVKTVVTDSGEFSARALIIATGAKHRTLGLEGEESFIGEGISFCAVCDGAFFAGKNVAVIGGGNSALQEAILLSDVAANVTVVQNLDFFTGEAKLEEQLRSKKNVNIILGATVVRYLGEESFSGIEIKEESGGACREIALDGLFLAVGLVPQNSLFEGTLELDERGYVKSGEDTLTSAKGIFAAGDCRTKRIRQVATAAADGAVAAVSACDYVDALKK